AHGEAAGRDAHVAAPRSGPPDGVAAGTRGLDQAPGRIQRTVAGKDRQFHRARPLCVARKRKTPRSSRRPGKLERVMGIEPTLAAWEAAVLPLNYTRTGRSLCGGRAPAQR